MSLGVQLPLVGCASRWVWGTKPIETDIGLAPVLVSLVCGVTGPLCHGTGGCLASHPVPGLLSAWPGGLADRVAPAAN